MALKFTQLDEALRLERALAKAVSDNDCRAIQDVLAALAVACLPASVLRSNPITRTVGKLRRHDNQAIHKSAHAIVAKWKAILDGPREKSLPASSSLASSPSSSASSSSQQPQQAASVGAFSVTFCDRAENHAGMQMIGDMAAKGFTAEELEVAAASMTQDLSITTEVFHLEELLDDGGASLKEHALTSPCDDFPPPSLWPSTYFGLPA